MNIDSSHPDHVVSDFLSLEPKLEACCKGPRALAERSNPTQFLENFKSLMFFNSSHGRAQFWRLPRKGEDATEVKNARIGTAPSE